MTLEDATQNADIYNGDPLAVTTAVVTTLIDPASYELDYFNVYITTTTLAAFNAADMPTQAKYGQAYVYAIERVKTGNDFVTEFDLKLTELLG